MNSTSNTTAQNVIADLIARVADCGNSSEGITLIQKIANAAEIVQKWQELLDSVTALEKKSEVVTPPVVTESCSLYLVPSSLCDGTLTIPSVLPAESLKMESPSPSLALPRDWTGAILECLIKDKPYSITSHEIHTILYKYGQDRWADFPSKQELTKKSGSDRWKVDVRGHLEELVLEGVLSTTHRSKVYKVRKTTDSPESHKLSA